MTENRRVRMTKMLMKDALLDILEREPIDRVRVTDVCKCADVNRSTFYAHYSGVGQLVSELESDAIGALKGLFSSGAKLSSALESAFEFIKSNERMYRVLLTRTDSDSFNLKLTDAIFSVFKKEPKADEAELDRTSESVSMTYEDMYKLYGVIGILKDWISEKFPISSRDFANLVMQMTALASPAV